MDFHKAQADFENIFAEINAFEISMGSRKKRNIQGQSFTYGEIEFESFSKILELVHPKDDEIFYDLGCGVGKPVFAAALLYPFSKVVGVELLPELCATASSLKTKFLRESANTNLQNTNIEFICIDMLELDFSEADIIYIASTCFDSEFMEKLAQKTSNLKKGTRIITLSKQLYASDLALVARKSFRMSWGDNTVIIVQKT